MAQVEVVKDSEQELSSWHCQQLESGGILLFPEMDLGLSEEDRRFLLGQRQSAAPYHKNIAYRPSQDTLTGVARGSDREQLRRILRSYSQQAANVLARLFPRYARGCQMDFTSFRPFEEQGRDLSLPSRNDLLHVDAFPTRPTNGDRILRFFTNLNPRQPRVWITAEPFEALATAFAREAGLAELARRSASTVHRALARLGRFAGISSLGRSPYDALMHRFHNFLKESRHFQETCRKERVEFPPGSSWLVFTDMVSHAVLGGQFALEQTFIVSREAMLRPERAPINVLERITAVRLSW